MTYVTAQKVAFHEATGQSWTALTQGISTSAAVITVLDWGFEIPQPVPPRIHVSRAIFVPLQ